jgi:ADP-ribose pyrophosphatase
MTDFDAPERWPVSSRRLVAHGVIIDLLEDRLESPEGEQLVREHVQHPGSVAILAIDEQERIAVVRQYRHAVGWRLLELPAGLLDIDGEPPLHAAQRELAEEAQLRADDWWVLADYFNSPGISDEQARIYLARGLHPTGLPEGFEPHGEEVDMGLSWVRVSDVLAGIAAGTLQNGGIVTGVLAYTCAQHAGVALRPGDAPWPALQLRDRYRAEHTE